MRLCLPQEEWAVTRFADRTAATATVTPIGSRQLGQPTELGRAQDRRVTAVAARPREGGLAAAPATAAAPEPAADHNPADPAQETSQPAPADVAAAAPAAKKAVGGRSRRASMPSWDEIMFGTSRQTD